MENTDTPREHGRRARFGIRQKMVVVLISVMTLALGSTGWLTYRQQEQDIVNETNKRGEDITRFVSQAVSTSVIGFDYGSIQLLLDELTKTQDVAFARVVNARGNTMAEAGVSNGQNPSWITFKREIVFDKQRIGELTIAVDNSRIVRQLEDKMSSMIGREAVIIILIAFGEFFALSFLIVRPVSIIHDSLESGVDGTGLITQDIPIKSGDEFGVLANLFNSMRSQLNDANLRLQSRIESADNALRETNTQLSRQSDELKRMNDELRNISVTDPLTGLFNRRHFETVMETDLALSLRHGEVSSLIIFDIDHFKHINDTYGHKCGDRVLADVARVLKANLRKTDTLCRIGGEEFVALCRRAGVEEASLVGEKIRAKIQEHLFQVRTQAITVTISIGIDTLPDGTTAGAVEDIFRRADMALYYSKNHGRNKVTHYAKVKDEIRSEPGSIDGEVA